MSERLTDEDLVALAKLIEAQGSMRCDIPTLERLAAMCSGPCMAIRTSVVEALVTEVRQLRLETTRYRARQRLEMLTSQVLGLNRQTDGMV